MAYGLHQQDAETRFLVFDLGGGTFDVSILEMFDGVMEVRASAGDNFLGGEDFLQALVDLFIERQALSGDLLKDRRFMQRRSEEHTSELQSPCNLVCRLLLEKK